MLFARHSLRATLGLTGQPTCDPDVKAGRLAVGDPYLARVLYGSAREQQAAAVHFSGQDVNLISAGRSAWDIARDKYASADTRYVFPDGTEKRGNRIRDWRKIPPGTRVVPATGTASDNEQEGFRTIGRDGASARAIAGDEHDQKGTIYFLADGRVKRGDELKAGELNSLPPGTRMLVGYMYGGYITAKRSAFDICGKKWDFPSTFYRLNDGSLRPGTAIRENAIPKNTMVFFAN